MLGIIKSKKKKCIGDVEVEVTVGVFRDGKNITEEIKVQVQSGATIKDVFLCLEGSGKLPSGLFKELMRDSSATLLKNGQRLHIPEDLSREVVAGDKLTIISSVAGG